MFGISMTKQYSKSFPERLQQPLDELAHQLLAQKQYGRLRLVAELLDVFSQGAWDRIEEDAQRTILKKMEEDFHIRAWDDWDWHGGSVLTNIRESIRNQMRSMGMT